MRALLPLLPLAPALILGAAAPARAQDDFLEFAKEDPAKIVTAEACGECHVAAYEVWETTPHANGFKTLHRSESAQAIAGKLGFRLIKRRSFCFSCHYTPVLDDGELKVVSGVSCESCHGAARDWIDVHNQYGEGRDHRTEPPEHRARRIERSVAGGMRRPSDLYPVAANCYGCHTVPYEELVNIGGHSTGSSDFELLAWSQGEIRHNFLDSFLAGGERVNRERPMERKRMMYVAGRALDLEYSLRGMARATETGVYAKAMIRRVRIAAGELRAVADEAELPEVDRMLSAVRGVEVVPGNAARLLGAAEAVGAATREFLARHDGTRLASLDDLVLGRAPAPVEESGAEAVAAQGGEAGAAAGAPGGASAQAAPARRTVSTAAAPAAVGAVGEIKRRIRPAPRHRTRGPGVCSGCHGPQNGWWFEDPHFAAADPFFARAPANVRIARLYGIDPDDMARGTSVCMDCHGTVVSGREGREVQDGVGCEECHGAADAWLEPHKDETDKHLGRRRPGYRAALERGKRPLHELGEKVEMCAECHYVTEPRLLSAGHPSGAEFDYAAGMAASRHWDEPLEPPAELGAAAAAVLAERGAVPKVRLATLPAAGAGPLPEALSGSGAAGAGAVPPRLRLPRARPLAGGPAAAAARAVPLPELPPAPEVTDATPVEEILRIVQERLRLLYRTLRSAGGKP